MGPDLHAVANHPPEKLLANILDPSADVQPGFNAYQVQLVDGTELYGLIAAETGNSLTFKLADGTPRLDLRKDVAALRGSGAELCRVRTSAGGSRSVAHASAASQLSVELWQLTTSKRRPER